MKSASDWFPHTPFYYALAKMKLTSSSNNGLGDRITRNRSETAPFNFSKWPHGSEKQNQKKAARVLFIYIYHLMTVFNNKAVEMARDSSSSPEGFECLLQTK